MADVSRLPCFISHALAREGELMRESGSTSTWVRAPYRLSLAMSPIRSTGSTLWVRTSSRNNSGRHTLTSILAGTIFFLLNVTFYLINVTMMTTRAIRHPRVFTQSFYDRSEAVWFPTSMLGMATLMIGTMLYGVPRCGVSSLQRNLSQSQFCT